MLNVEVKNTRGRSVPERGLILNCRFKWWLQNNAFLLGLNGRLSFGDRVLNRQIVSDKISFQGLGQHYSFMRSKDEFSADLSVTLSREAILFIEKQRREDDVALQLHIGFVAQEVFPAPGKKGQQFEQFLSGRVFWEETAADFPPIPRSDWLKRLKELEWEETELFEIRALPLKSDDNLKQALHLLREAQIALRNCDYKTVLAKCRQTFESAAKYHSKGNTAKGFELLLSKAFPEHEDKRKNLDAFIKTFSEYAHNFARHEQFPAVEVSRGEAEFALVVSFGLFSLLSRRLTNSDH